MTIRMNKPIGCS